MLVCVAVRVMLHQMVTATFWPPHALDAVRWDGIHASLYCTPIDAIAWRGRLAIPLAMTVARWGQTTTDVLVDCTVVSR